MKTRRKTSYGKQSKQIAKAWYQNDIQKWIILHQKQGIRISMETTNSSPVFLEMMREWNDRPSTKHFVKTKSWTDKTPDPDWDPYCCSDRPCSSGASDRMERKDYGWYCRFCGNKISKQMYRLK
jgi:hypothetical protein